MPQVTIIYGTLLVALGLWGKFGVDSGSVTALIPAFFGAPLIVCGLLARNERFLKHAMHVAAMLALVGTLGSFRGLLKLPALLAGEELERPMAVVSQSVMAALSIVFVALCVRSFIQARRARTYAQS